MLGGECLTHTQLPFLTQYPLPQRLSHGFAFHASLDTVVSWERLDSSRGITAIVFRSCFLFSPCPTLPLIYPPGTLRFNGRRKRLPRNSVKKKNDDSHTMMSVVGVFWCALGPITCPILRKTGPCGWVLQATVQSDNKKKKKKPYTQLRPSPHVPRPCILGAG